MLWILIAAAVIALAVLIAAYVCFRIAFYVPEGQGKSKEEYPIPDGEIYEPFRDTMVGWIKKTRTLEHDDVYITSFDGLRLHGRYYECAPGAPIELMFHGYRGEAERDLCGGVLRCFAIGRNVLIVDQRACGDSEGNVISFGINERRDCLRWVDYLIKRFGGDVKIILTGISMGASTVLMAGGEKLPDNVVMILADCGFTSAKDIIYKTIREMKLPPKLAYPFVKLGARIFGHFDVDETSAIEAVKRCRLPIIFVHGESDDFVPCDMSRRLHATCKTPKALLTVPQAGHGLAYIMDSDAYFDMLCRFCNQQGLPTAVDKSRIL